MFFFFNDPATTEIYTLSLHDALPISGKTVREICREKNILPEKELRAALDPRSEEHTSELQSRFDLVCRLLLEKKKKDKLSLILPNLEVDYADLKLSCSYI